MAVTVLSLWLLFAFADERTAIADFLGDAATDLSNGDARGFLKRFDRDMPGYGKLETEIQALVKLAGVGSSAQVLEFKAVDDRFLLTVDWFIELRPHGQDLTNERRRELLQVTVKRAGKNWKIHSLEPQTIFNAPRL
jgi:hypothetical protein